MMVSSLASVSSPDNLQRIQRVRKWTLRGLFGAMLVPLLFIDSYWYARGSALYDAIEWLGIVLILAYIFGRTWCSLYIGGRKKRELVITGPYSLVRNPLYAFSLLGVFGAGAQFGSLLVACCFTVLAFVVFDSVVRKEERFLVGEFPAEFQAYAGRVHRFLPRFAAWRDADELVVRPRLVQRTFRDACLLLISIPATDVLKTLQGHDMIPVLLHLP